MADPISVEVALRVRPISTEDWMKLPQREQQLSAIADVIGYWITWVTKDRQAENLPLNPDAHIIFPGDDAPPHWPSVGQLSLWLKVLRAHPDIALSNTSDTARVRKTSQRFLDAFDAAEDDGGYRLWHEVNLAAEELRAALSASTIPDVGEGK